MIGYDDRRLESFLFDELPSPDREELEQRLFADDELFARVEELENDLIDSYVAGTLPPETRVRLESSLEGCPARREKVLVARLLRERTAGARNDAGVVPFPRRGRLIVRGALAAAFLAVVVGSPLLLQRNDEKHAADVRAVASNSGAATDVPSPAPQVVETTVTDSAITTEIPLVATGKPAVTTPPAVGTPLASTTFVLSMISLRSATGLESLEIGEDVGNVEMQLVLESDEYPSYNVNIRNSSGASIWQASRLPVTTVEGGPGIRFDVPASTFTTGRHELVLAGVDEDHTEEIAYVDFEVQARR